MLVVLRAPFGVHREQPVDGMPRGDLLGDPGILVLLSEERSDETKGAEVQS
jgi:hypothetical protein